MSFFIPEKLSVGFVKREDTFTGKLAFVTYYDNKNIRRQEHSWNGWRDHSISVLEIENKPSRFVINKGIQRSHYFGSGRSKIRIYDERDFEFEITVDNLIALLMHSDVSKRDILEQCVFAWKGKDLTLLPLNSEEYLEATKHTLKQTLKLSSKDLVPGQSYSSKKDTSSWLYLGSFQLYSSYNNKTIYQDFGKQHVFYQDHKEPQECYKKFAVSELAEVVSLDHPTNFSNILEKFLSSMYHLGDNKIIKLLPANAKESLQTSYFYPHSTTNTYGELLSLIIENNKIISFKLEYVNLTKNSSKDISIKPESGYSSNGFIYDLELQNLTHLVTQTSHGYYHRKWTESKKLEALKKSFSPDLTYSEKDILKILTKLKFCILS